MIYDLSSTKDLTGADNRKPHKYKYMHRTDKYKYMHRTLASVQIQKNIFSAPFSWTVDV